ncbi:hypothetical protein M8C21_032982 [Ambrosia artemisiifolia]|uniref:Reverse transcriptase zinc-binding domain-containing protein n=1 Tax=Ambrosia artemisiifolia TaxID=4212 RepID=A0AAD5CEB8_AMBAR|nr:hypothetical protein M8C21_032982 [Ambrosia artemisiifolia]
MVWVATAMWLGFQGLNNLICFLYVSSNSDWSCSFQMVNLYRYLEFVGLKFFLVLRSFPVFKIASMKLLIPMLIQTWEWVWIGEPASNCEVEQANNMQELLNNISLLENSDQWTWENKSGGNVSVKDLRMELQNMIQGPINSPPSLWNTWAPLKVNYFLWRACMDRAATKLALASRGFITNKFVVSTTSSLQHTVVVLVNKTKLDDEIKSWLAFAAQKALEAGQKDKGFCFLQAFFTANAVAHEGNAPQESPMKLSRRILQMIVYQRHF